MKCYIAVGALSDGHVTSVHMWNIVNIDGVSYLADVTNSESDAQGANGELFLVCADDAVYSESAGYIFAAGEVQVTYTYDSVTFGLYGEDVLTLGSANSASTGETEESTEESTEVSTEESSDESIESDGQSNTDGNTDANSNQSVSDVTEKSEYKLGDVNGDDEINYLDAMTVLRYDVG